MSARFVANARMYAVTPEVEAAWTALIGHVLADAGLGGPRACGETAETGLPQHACDHAEEQTQGEAAASGADSCFEYLPWPAPQPLEDLWRRPDLGCAFMCGYPIALGLAEVTPIAAPVPAEPWAEGRAVYRTDLIVHAAAPCRTLEDTFGGRIGWTVDHSHSGFNALRHHLLRYRTPERPTLYAQSVGPLVTARAVLDAVAGGRIDVGPLDAYWHALLRRHRPALTGAVRILESTATVPAPAFVAGPGVSPDIVERLKAAFAAASGRPWFAALAGPLCLAGFAPVSRDDYAVTLTWAEEARAAGYTGPA